MATGDIGHQLGDLPLIEPGQLEDVGAAGDPQQRVVCLAFPVGAEQQQRRSRHLLGHEIEREQRVQVRPVQVVEDHGHRLPAGGFDERPAQPVEEGEPRKVGGRGGRPC